MAKVNSIQNDTILSQPPPNANSPQRSSSTSSKYAARVDDDALSAFESALINKRNASVEASTGINPVQSPHGTINKSPSYVTTSPVSASQPTPINIKKNSVSASCTSAATTATTATTAASAVPSPTVASTTQSPLLVSQVMKPTILSNSGAIKQSPSSSRVSTLTRGMSIPAPGGAPQELASSSTFAPSGIGQSLLVLHSTQQLQMLESRFRFLTQSFKEKVANPLFGVETQITRSAEADLAREKIHSLHSFYSELEVLMNRYTESLKRVAEVESELSHFFNGHGYREKQGPLRTGMIEMGSALQIAARESSINLKSLETFQAQVSTFLNKAIDDALDTCRRQSTVRTELDAATIKLLPTMPELEKLKVPMQGLSYGLGAGIHGLGCSLQAVGKDLTNLGHSVGSTLTSSIAGLTGFGAKKADPVLVNGDAVSCSSNTTAGQTQHTENSAALHPACSNLHNPVSEIPNSTSTEPIFIPPELSSPVHRALEDKYNKLTTQLVDKCTLLDSKMQQDLMEQLLALRKSGAVYHCKVAEVMLSETKGEGVSLI